MKSVGTYRYRKKADDDADDRRAVPRLVDICVSIPRVQINSIKFAAAQVLNAI